VSFRTTTFGSNTLSSFSKSPARIYAFIESSKQVTNEVNDNDQLEDRDVGETGTRKRMGTKPALDYVKSKLLKNNPDVMFLQNKYGVMKFQFKSAGSMPFSVKVWLSKDYRIGYENELNYKNKIACSWHKESFSKCGSWDYVVYAVECGESYKALLLTKDEVNRYLEQKEFNDMINYYFHWHSDGKVEDVRESEPIDVTAYDAEVQMWKLK
jgi:hypothetical protein